MRIQRDRFKSFLYIEVVFLAGFILMLLFAPIVWGQVPKTEKPKPTPKPLAVHGTVEIGVQLRAIQGGHNAKFQEVRDVPKGFFVQKLKLDVDSIDSPYYLRFRGLEIRENDQRFTVNGGRIGKFRAQFVWDQTPHNFGTGQSFLQQTSPGVYQVSSTLRANFQALTLPDSVRTPPTGPLSTLVRQELLTAPTTVVKLRRDQATFKFSYQPSKNVELHAQISWLRTRGTRPLSVGTFVRRPVPGNGLGDIGGLWEGIGQELLEPVDHRTTNLRVGARFSGERWSVGVDYTLSLFRNRISTLTFENPFRVTNEEGCLPPLPPQTCGAINRFRTVRWQSDLAPNNDSQTITFWGKVNLTPQTQVRGLISLNFLKQNDPFLPWTLNTAIVPTHWDAVSPITNPTDVNQLPASSANAKTKNITQQYAMVNRRKNFRFQAQYRSHSLDNQTPTIIFPGYAAFGDSTWRAARTDFFNLPIENLDWDFTRQNAEAGFEWSILSPERLPDGRIAENSGLKTSNLTWKVDYEWEGWNRTSRDVNRNNEHSIRNRLDFEFDLSGGGKNSDGEANPVTTLRLKADYTYANRRALLYNTQPLTFVANFPGSPVGGNTTAYVILPPSGTNPGTVFTLGVPTEFNLLRRYDQSDRTRNDASLTLEMHMGANTNFSASYRYMGEKHDENFYGRLFNRFSFVDTEFTHTFGNGGFLYANYSRETNRLAYRDLAHLLPAPNPLVQGVFAQFPIANTWERTSRSNLDNFEFGINVAPQEGKLQKWQFDLSYAISSARDKITSFNPYTVRPDSVLHAGVFPYPDTVIKRQNVNLAITRRINENYEIGFRYWYEPYTQDDFSYNILQPYVHGSATSDTPKYLFQDARYASYHGNVANFFVRYSF